jgi:hypothetical protein
MSKPTHPLPLEARRVLWTRIWDRLLAPPRIDIPSSPAPTRDGRPADPLAAAQDREGQP